MDFEGECFSEFSRTQGRLRAETPDGAQEKDFASANFINAAGTIGYAEVTVDGKADNIFLSKTLSGIVLTMPGEQSGPAPFPMEGYKVLTTVLSGSPARDFYGAHLRALGDEKPVSDRPWLEKEVPVLGQRALDVTMKIFALVCEQMDKMMSGLGNAMGEMIEGMGKAMGEAMEGVGKAMGGAMDDLGKSDIGPVDAKLKDIPAPPEKASLAPAVMATSRKKPAKKKRAAKAPAKKAAVRKAAPKKKPARKAVPKGKTPGKRPDKKGPKKRK